MKVTAFKVFLLGIVISCTQVMVFAQSEKSNGDVPFEENQIENLIESIDNDGELDFNTLYEDLEVYLSSPLDLNDADYTTLKESRLLNDIQINDLQNHKAEFGDLLSIHELQSIPSFDLKTIKALEPFVKVGGGLYNYNLSLGDMIKSSKSELFIKWRRVLEQQQGFDPERTNGFEGDPNKLYTRFKMAHENRFRVTLIGEKDPGEAFFAKSNPRGFDFYSGHVHLKEYSSVIKDIIIGDYTVSFGQGLVLHNGFGSNKSSYVMDIKKGGRQLRSYNSINELNYNRGIATTLQLMPKVQLTTFFSSTDVDASIFTDTSDIDVGLEAFSSFRTSGFHRTPSEIENERNLKQTSTGASLKYDGDRFKIGLNALYNYFDKELQRSDNLFNKFRFSGDKLFNASVDYSYFYQNIHVFGETAYSDNGAIATLNGVLIGLDKNVDFSLLHRSLPRDYQVLNGNAFGETIGASNENGIYSGLIIRPLKSWTVSAYFDVWNHPWLRTRQDGPSDGKEFLVNVNYYKKRKFNFYLQYKYETKQENSPLDFRIDQLDYFQIHRLRAHFDHSLSKSFSLRNRIEFSRHLEEGKISSGYLIFQDVLYKPIASPFSFTARYAFFDTFDFDSRIFAYENDLIYEFFIPQFSGRGSRYYINMRYDIGNITLEFRYAQTLLDFRRETDGTILRPITFGSGNTEIEEPKQTEIKAQIRYKF